MAEIDPRMVKWEDSPAVNPQMVKWDAPPPQPQPPSAASRIFGGATKGFQLGGMFGVPVGATTAAGQVLNDAISQGAYDAGGKVTDIAARSGMAPEDAAKLGFVTNVGVQAVPAVAGSALGKLAAPLFENAGREMMQSALKPTLKALQTGQAATAIQTMLDEGANATASGVMKLKGKIYQLNHEIKTAIANSPATVDKQAVYAPLQQTLDKFSKQVNPNADMAAVQGAWDEFLNHPVFSGQTIPVQGAQQLKQGTYRVLDGKYGQMGSAETEAQKAIARGLKDEIARVVPEVAPLNAQESNLLAALKIAERRAMMQGNHNPMGLSLLAHNPASILAFMADRSSGAKSLLARGLYSGSEGIPQVITGSAIGLGGLLRGNQ